MKKKMNQKTEQNEKKAKNGDVKYNICKDRNGREQI